MLKKIKKIAVILGVLTAIIVLLSAVSIERNEKVVNGLIINVLDTSLFFVNGEDTKELLTDLGCDSGANINDINIANVERILGNTPFVQSVNVYIDISGKLNVKLKQRRPILRFFTEDKMSYYITEDGMVIRTQDDYTSRVLIATGAIDYTPATSLDSVGENTVLKNLFDFARFIQKDEFWRSQIAQIDVDENGVTTCVPQVGNHLIKIGKMERLEEKFENLSLFYKDGLSKTGWNEYSMINLMYEGQIICNKQ
ncbi:MAG: hypothetical protein MRY83_10650 [Flavobacteriales bacterium]|nr:hypothetical protein [Flavobacteriales bacterium]